MPRAVWIEHLPMPLDEPAFHPDPLLARLLAGRVADATAAADFLDPSPRPAPDPLGLPGMAAAVDRVARAVGARAPIAIFGDYDVDGISATALLVRALRAAGAGRGDLVARLPRRAEGYGLNPDAVRTLAAVGTKLLIAVDCGSTDHGNVELAQSLGMEAVVLDHHQMEDAGPPGATVVSAQLRPDGAYRELAAAGVAYLLAVALARAGFDVGAGAGQEPVHLLDLAMLGTVADVSPLTGLNRPLVRDGLRQVALRPRPGLHALCERARVDITTVTSEQVAYRLAPRLNAAGRMADPRLALDLLLTDDPQRAAMVAQELERLNAQRRVESERVVAEAEELLRARPDFAERRLLVLARPGWGSGVLGLAATRLVERVGRPVVILSDDGELSRGSARSVPGFDIVHALSRCAALLHTHGGHSQAAGLAVPSERVTALEAALEAAIDAAELPPPGPPSLTIEADLPPDRLELRTAELIDTLEPFGAGNPRPLLRVRDVAVRSYNAIGQDGRHLKLFLETPRGVVPALFWGAVERSRELVRRPRIDFVAALSIDRWNGQRRLQVEVRDFQPAE